MNSMNAIRNLFTYRIPEIKLAVKELQSAKFYTIFLVLVTLTGNFVFSPVISSLMNDVVIRSTGQISTTNITATSGSAEDIQAAVDAVAAAGGGTVYVPEGDFVFTIDPNKIGIDNCPVGVEIVGGINIIGAGVDKTILYQPTNAPDPSSMFIIDGGNGKPVRISGITFRGHVEDEAIDNRAIAVYGAKDFRIDHCNFTDFVNYGILTSRNYRKTAIHCGVIDHCNFDNPYKDDPNVIGAGAGGRKIWAYGIGVTGTYYNWEEDINNLLGQYRQDTVYIEDCNFSRCRHAVASNGGGWYVVRHCTFREPRPEHYGIIDVHGTSGPAPGVGGRGLEAYNNEFYGCEYAWPEPTGTWHSIAFGLRGGGGVVFNNTIIDCKYGVGLYEDLGSQEKCKIKDMWIWNNVMTQQNAPSSGTLILNYAGYSEDVDFFLYEKPGYVPYPYPLTLEATP